MSEVPPVTRTGDLLNHSLEDSVRNLPARPGLVQEGLVQEIWLARVGPPRAERSNLCTYPLSGELVKFDQLEIGFWKYGTSSLRRSAGACQP